MKRAFYPHVGSILPVVAVFLGIWLLLVAAGMAQPQRGSLLNSDPEVVYLNEVFEKPLKLKVVKPAPIYADREGQRQLSTLREGQMVEVLGITKRAYRVRGQGTSNQVVGWVGLWAFEFQTPEFSAQLEKLYERQIQVRKLIDAGQLAIGMNLKEVAQVMGQPTKTSVRQTPSGQAGSWEFIDYEEIRNYATHVDPYTGQTYRTLVSVTREVKERTVVEFENGYVTALEESENHAVRRRNITVILPPLLCRW